MRKNILINLQNRDAWKIQLTIAIKFISSKDAELERVMHSSRSDILASILNICYMSRENLQIPSIKEKFLMLFRCALN